MLIVLCKKNDNDSDLLTSKFWNITKIQIKWNNGKERGYLYVSYT